MRMLLAVSISVCVLEYLQVVLEVKGEAQLVNLSKKLADAGIDHHMWMEQPENFPTCLATRPQRKSQVHQYFKKLRLFR